ncbi:MAG: 4-hydroxybutyryl-CoA dehydratase [Candidatus Coatesbacteria bacterium]|nr:4-hydroxybutyryl-CoA dehydratase [Candidatus Coatesbacteria bacterium]
MTLKSSQEYLESIKKRKPMEIWFRGEKIDDPTTYGPLSSSLNAMMKVYELAQDSDIGPLMTVESTLVNGLVNFYVAPLMSREDAVKKTKMARILAEVLGCCSHRCTGSEAISGLYPLTYDMDEIKGTDYHERLKKWIKYVQDNDLACTATLTDPKGDRKLTANKQKHPDFYLRIKEKRDDGIVISGAKVNQTGIIFAHEVVIVPTNAFSEDEKEYAVACAIPADTPGMTYVLGRTPQDLRLAGDEIEKIDAGKEFADHQATVIFEDVFVPNERIFMCEDYEFTPLLLEYFTAVHRITAGGCKCGGLCMLTGAADLAIEYIGAEKAGHVKNKLAEMVIKLETLYALSLAAGFEGFEHPSGAWIPNSLLAHCTKFQATCLPFEDIAIAREFLTGWGETAPAAKDLFHPVIGPKLEKYFTPVAKEGATAEDRLRVVRLIEHLCRGSNWTAMAIHGGGNMEAARLMAYRHTDWNKLKDIAATACGVSKDKKKTYRKIAERKGQIDFGEKGFKAYLDKLKKGKEEKQV